MALVERLAILTDANASGATREFRKLSTEAAATDKSLTGIQKSSALLKGALAGIGLTAAAAGVANFANQSIQAASALGEMESKARVVFGGQFGRIEEFATETADALNLSERAAFQFAGSFGQLFDSAGLAEKDAADLSISLTTFASDIASFNDISVDEAFQKLRSGLSGEAEPLRQVGVFLTEAKVKTEAYSSGIADAGEALTEAQKIQARYNIILRETESAQGDVARTSESLANQQRSLAAETEDLKASLGEELAPDLAQSLGVVNDLLGAVSDVNAATQAATGGRSIFDVWTDGALSVLGPMGAGIQQLFDWSDAQREAGDSAGDASSDIEAAYTAVYDLDGAVSTITPHMADLAELSRDVGAAQLDAVDGSSSLASQFAYVGDEADVAAAGIEALTSAIEQMRSPVLDVRQANRDLAQSIEDYDATLKDSEATQRDQQEALDGIAASAFDVLNAYAEAGASSVDLQNKTQALREDFIKAAERMGMTREEARKLANRLGLIPSDVPINVQTAGLQTALETAERLASVVSGLSQSELVSIVRQDEAMARRGADGYRASGGPVSAGSSYMVGEQGPELLTMTGRNGFVTSSGKTRALGANNSRTIHVHGDLVLQTPDPSRSWDSLNSLAVMQ